MNPWIAVLAVPISIIGGYLLAPGDRGLLAYQNSVIKIFDSRYAADDLRILDENNTPIKADIFAIETTLENVGNVPLSKDRLRRPLTVKFPGGNVVQSRVSASADPDVTGFTVSDASDSVVLEWRNFDPGHFVKIVSLVSAKEDIEPVVTGEVLGVPLRKGVDVTIYQRLFVIGFGIFLIIVGPIGAFHHFNEAVNEFRSSYYVAGIFTGIFSLILGAMGILGITLIYASWYLPVISR